MQNPYVGVCVSVYRVPTGTMRGTGLATACEAAVAEAPFPDHPAALWKPGPGLACEEVVEKKEKSFAACNMQRAG